MGWRRHRRDTRNEVEVVVGDRLMRRCNELGARGWELVSTFPLSRLALSGGGRVTSTQLFFNRRLP